MATVIPLPSNRDVADGPIATTHDPVDRALRLLERRVGDRAVDLPPARGRVAAEVEALLVDGPCAVDWAALEPAAAIAIAGQVVRTARVLIDLISDETDVLAEVLCGDLHTISLNDLHDAVDAAVKLSASPRPAALWADPRAAEAADLALGVVADDLRSAARLHADLYEHFTERVWLVPSPLLKAGRRRWRPIARVRLRRHLGAASRSGRVASMAATATAIMEVRSARDRIDSLAPLLAHHLAELDNGPLTDVDAALDALRAIRRLQSSLGDALDHERLAQLLLADAFRSGDVVTPSVHVRTAIRAWRADLDLAGSARLGNLDLDQLAEWTQALEPRLTELADAHEATLQAGVQATTLRSLVEILLVREHLEELMTKSRPMTDTDHASSAS